VVRNSIEQKSKAEAAKAKAKELGEEADRLRLAARGTEGLISEAIAKVDPRGLRFQDGRLVLDTVRGETFFGDLSDGERWRIALDIAIDAGGPGCVIPIEQGAWQDLDPSNRAAIARHAQERQVTILTAECDDGELRAEVFEPVKATNGKATTFAFGDDE
jgi:hypothetical protein